MKARVLVYDVVGGIAERFGRLGYRFSLLFEESRRARERER